MGKHFDGMFSTVGPLGPSTMIPSVRKEALDLGNVCRGHRKKADGPVPAWCPQMVPQIFG